MSKNAEQIKHIHARCRCIVAICKLPKIYLANSAHLITIVFFVFFGVLFSPISSLNCIYNQLFSCCELERAKKKKKKQEIRPAANRRDSDWIIY